MTTADGDELFQCTWGSEKTNEIRWNWCAV